MKYLIVISLLISSGCAHTTHEYCQAHVEKYRDYDQCYSEVSRNGKPKGLLSRMLAGAGDGLQKGSHEGLVQNNLNCTSNGYGGYHCQ